MSQRTRLSGRIEWKRLFHKLSPYTIKKGLRYLKHFGFREFLVRLQERFEPEEIPYEDWYKAYCPSEKELETERETLFSSMPRISIAVPAYHTSERFLRELLDSLEAQTYHNWELCLVNASPDDSDMNRVLEEYQQRDPRIRVKMLSVNRGISENTNAAFAMAEGEYTGLLDHDDLLAPNAVYEVVKAIQREADADVIYSDEDKITADGLEHFQPHMKPDFNLDLLRSNNYICHFLVVRTELIRQVGGLRPEFDGAQDYDFIFRCTEKARKIVHIPEILYHWRTHRESTADNPDSKRYAYEAGKRAIEEHMSRSGVRGKVLMLPDHGFYRVKYPLQRMDKVSIIIPNKDGKELLSACISSILRHTEYDNYEILIVENNSTTSEIFEYYKELEKNPKIRILRWEREFNYSAINNFAAQFSDGDFLLFLNNDIRIREDGWMEEMLGVCQRPEVGAAGVKLIYPDHTIQHAGIVIGMGGIAGAMFVGMPVERSGYLHKASLLQDMSAVTAACMMVNRERFHEVGGFTEKLAVAFNDVELCLKLREKGYLIVYDPFVCHFHDESKTRGAEDTPEKVRRFQEEIEYMREHWIRILKEGDPCYNKNLSLTKWNYSLKLLPGMEIRKESNE